MANKQINARVALKHDIEQNWITAGENGFCPLAGEVIIYDIDNSENGCSQYRYKIGRKDDNGNLINIKDLPFESNVYVGRNEPMNVPAGFIWVDTSDETVDEERLEGDGQEFYTMAPSTLSFRSTAPLEELQDIQINGQTVDPANYTLEEGSTIVKLKHDYLSTLDVGKYELSVVSDSKTAKGDFTVTSPELNEYGLLLNIPYYATYDMWGDEYSLTILFEHGHSGKVSYYDGGNEWLTESFDYSFINGQISFAFFDREFNGIITVDGKQISGILAVPDAGGFETSILLDTTSETLFADHYYIYEIFNDVSVQYRPIDKTLTNYPVAKNNICNIPVTTIADNAFDGSSAESIVIPHTVTDFGWQSFMACESLTSITFEGTVEQWNAISKDPSWNLVPATYVQCSDGQVAL